jgi:hypothetical protein
LVEGPADLWLLARMALFAFAVPLLERRGLEKLQALLEPRRPPVAPDPRHLRKVGELGVALVQAGRPLLRANCRTQGLTLYYFLREAGLEVTLCFGLGARGDTYSGHCWLAVQGEPYLEPPDPRPRYQEFYRFPSGGVPAAGRERESAP